MGSPICQYRKITGLLNHLVGDGKQRLAGAAARAIAFTKLLSLVAV
jgi:hypothetical protein